MYQLYVAIQVTVRKASTIYECAYMCGKNMYVIGPRTRTEEERGVKSQSSGVTVLEAGGAVADGLRCFLWGAGTENAYGSCI